MRAPLHRSGGDAIRASVDVDASAGSRGSRRTAKHLRRERFVISIQVLILERTPVFFSSARIAGHRPEPITADRRRQSPTPITVRGGVRPRISAQSRDATDDGAAPSVDARCRARGDDCPARLRHEERRSGSAWQVIREYKKKNAETAELVASNDWSSHRRVDTGTCDFGTEVAGRVAASARCWLL